MTIRLYICDRLHVLPLAYIVASSGLRLPPYAGAPASGHHTRTTDDHLGLGNEAG